MGPRSSGCRACVRRRVKCDETRPFCKRCQKAKLSCPGFRDPFVFVNETDVIAQGSIPVPKRYDRSRTTSSAARSAPVDFGLARRLSPPSHDVHIAYLLERFVATGPRYIDHTSNSVWMKICLTRPEHFPIATSAIQCLAASFFGRQHHTGSITFQAAQSYSSNLRHLAQALQDSRKAWSFDVLAATTALNFYEYVSFTSSKGWIQHARGVANLLETYGPNRLRDYPERCILETSRSMVIGEALADRRKTFLENDEWWTPDPGPEPEIRSHHTPYGPGYRPQDELEQLYARLPGLAERVQAHQASNTDILVFAAQVEESRRKILAFEEDLDTWYATWSQIPEHIPHEISTEDGSGISRDEDGDLFNTVFDFENVRIAKAFTLYSLMRIAILEWQHNLSDLTWQRGFNHEHMAAIPKTKPHAMDICRSVDYHFKIDHGQIAAFYISLPCRFAYYALPRLSREAQWLERVLDTVANSNGMEFARNILHNIPLRKQKVVSGYTRLLIAPRDL